MEIMTWAQAKHYEITGKVKINTPVDMFDGYFLNGLLHRTNGPAYGRKYWYINDENITSEVNKWRKEYGFKKLPLTKGQEMLFKLRFLYE